MYAILNHSSTHAIGPFLSADQATAAKDALPAHYDLIELESPAPVAAAVVVRRSERGMSYLNRADNWVSDPAQAAVAHNTTGLARFPDEDGVTYSIERRVIFNPVDPSAEHLRTFLRFHETGRTYEWWDAYGRAIDIASLPDTLGRSILQVIAHAVMNREVVGVVLSLVTQYLASHLGAQG